VHSDDFFDFPMSQTVRFAEQDLSELRNEQQLYRAALALVADLERGIEADVQTVQDCICTIAEKASYWPAQWRREQQLRMSGQGYEQQALWHFEQDNLRHLDIWKSMAIHPRQTLGQRLSKVPAALSRSETVRAGHLVICNLVNSFPSLVYLWGETAIEGPHWDLTFGIRPVLFYILRREYLSASGIAVCRNTDCRQLFEIERAGQHYCGDMCSRRQRQREYWEGRGKELRKLRIEKQKPVSVNRRSGRTPQTSQDRARKGK